MLSRKINTIDTSETRKKLHWIEDTFFGRGTPSIGKKTRRKKVRLVGRKARGVGPFRGAERRSMLQLSS